MVVVIFGESLTTLKLSSKRAKATIQLVQQ